MPESPHTSAHFPAADTISPRPLWAILWGIADTISPHVSCNAYWQGRSREWSHQAQRDARAEITDKGMSRSQRAAEAREAREARNRQDNERGGNTHGRDVQGGRGR